MRSRNGRPKTKKRVWRGLAFPGVFDASEFASRRMTPLPCDAPGYEVSYHRPKRFKGFLESHSPVKYRETVIVIRRSGELVGYLKFEEFDLGGEVDNDVLWEWLDAESAYHGELAAALCAEWEDVEMEVAGYGPIVHFDIVWIRRDHSRGKLWKTVAQAAFETLFSNRSIVVFKPFPLEYSGLSDIAPVGLKRRSAAIRRMSSRFAQAYRIVGLRDCDDWYWTPRPKIKDFIKGASQRRHEKPPRLGYPVGIHWHYETNFKPVNDNYD